MNIKPSVFATLFLALTAQISALPDMKKFPHDASMVENTKMYISKAENLMCFNRYYAKGTGEYLYAYCPITKHRVFIFGLDDNFGCVVQNPKNEMEVAKEWTRLSNGDCVYFWFEDGSFLLYRYEDNFYGGFRTL